MSSGAVRSRRVALTDNAEGGDRPPRPACIHFEDGVITRITAFEDFPGGGGGTDLGNAVLFPGLVDTHVHINEPGRTHWEGFATATRAAAAGGITTLVDMPLNSVPTTITPEAVAAKRRAGEGKLSVDVGLWGGLVPESCQRLEALAAAGVLGFKAFLTDSGIDEFPAAGREHLEAALPFLAESGLPLLVHAEWPAGLREMDPAAAHSHAAWRASRPPAAEVAAVQVLLDLWRQRPFRLHIVHVATEEVLPLLRAARATGPVDTAGKEGPQVTAETCPHYLTFAAEEIESAQLQTGRQTGPKPGPKPGPEQDATLFKCAPPIRGARTREALWQALRDGDLDLVATDHSPAPPDLKELESGDFQRAWGGIASLQLSLPAVWTEAHRRGIEVQRLVPWLCENPARLAGLEGRKGSLAVGCDADLVAWDPEASFEVDPTALFHRHPITPYAGRRLLGRIEATWLRGRPIFRRDHPMQEIHGVWL